ncbi:hypothetical protein LEP1GSC126_1802 [Leptospira kirschneri str. 200801774]|nr:hypothetical protein LEP1GSC126_1802 [Leptospira kirschneri str. 200801774]
MGTKSKFYKRKSESGLAAPTKNLQVTSNETTARIFNSVRDFSQNKKSHLNFTDRFLKCGNYHP